MSEDQQGQALKSSVSETGSSVRPNAGSGGSVATAIALSFAMQHTGGRQRFWPPKRDSGQHLADRHEGDLRALEFLRHYRDSERTPAPLLHRILDDALTDGQIDAPQFEGFVRVIDDLLMLSARVVRLDEYGRALALQHQAEREVAQAAGSWPTNPVDGATD